MTPDARLRYLQPTRQDLSSSGIHKRCEGSVRMVEVVEDDESTLSKGCPPTIVMKV